MAARSAPHIIAEPVQHLPSFERLKHGLVDCQCPLPHRKPEGLPGAFTIGCNRVNLFVLISAISFCRCLRVASPNHMHHQHSIPSLLLTAGSQAERPPVFCLGLELGDYIVLILRREARALGRGTPSNGVPRQLSVRSDSMPSHLAFLRHHSCTYSLESNGREDNAIMKRVERDTILAFDP